MPLHQMELFNFGHRKWFSCLEEGDRRRGTCKKAGVKRGDTNYSSKQKFLYNRRCIRYTHKIIIFTRCTNCIPDKYVIPAAISRAIFNNCLCKS